MTQRPIQLVVSYDGSDFAGWQRQKNERSVQEEIEKALEKMHGHPVRLTGAGRTDAGVHALGQVAGFFTDIASIPAEKFLLALNKLLPRDIRILSAGEAPRDFHARFDASLRKYRYFFLCGGRQDAFSRRYAWSLSHQPSIGKLNAMASVIVGEHDFSAFASAKDISVSKSRFIQDSSFWFEDGKLVYQVSANAFLWRMVRSLVGTMIFFEPKADTEADAATLMLDILDRADRSKAGPTAPPYGLFLWNVEYGERAHGHRRRRSEEDSSEASEGSPSELQPARLVPGIGFVDETSILRA
ncbi:MAG TPA: tRNA pseudouridine(38-40) synthase TruA [Rectinemataceae bacterium]|nr:tRNA pseudouridine(38-40) synthase TruA [Rectinemataceae bacterium]